MVSVANFSCPCEEPAMMIPGCLFFASWIHSARSNSCFFRSFFFIGISSWILYLPRRCSSFFSHLVGHGAFYWYLWCGLPGQLMLCSFVTASMGATVTRHGLSFGWGGGAGGGGLNGGSSSGADQSPLTLGSEPQSFKSGKMIIMPAGRETSNIGTFFSW